MPKRVMLRVPAGLPGAGRFTSAPALLKMARTVNEDRRLVIVDSLSEAADRQARLTAKALRSLTREARRFDDDPKRYARSRAKAEAAWQTAQAQEDFLVATAEQVLAPMVDVIPPIVTPRRRRPEREHDEPEPEDEAVEWEMGMVYQAARGRDGDFDMNVRVRRTDARSMKRPEAERVLVLFREALDRYNPMMPPGYVMAAIDWRRPSWGTNWRRSLGSVASHLHAFLNPLYVKADAPEVWHTSPLNVRLGSVK